MVPLYRQTEIYTRIGVELDRTTLANWMVACGKLVQPLNVPEVGQARMTSGGLKRGVVAHTAVHHPFYFPEYRA